MAMTKREKEEVELLKLELAQAKALHTTNLIEPNVPPPIFGEPLTTGYIFNEHSMCVYAACSSSIEHGIHRTDKTNSQRPLALYSSPELAWKALRAVLERKFATSLLIIDKKIARNEVNTD